MKERDYFNKRIFRKLVTVSFIQNLTLSVTGMIDCAIVGQFIGADGLSAMKIAMPIFAVLSLFSTVFSSGLTVRVSKEMTEGNKELASEIVNSVFSLSLFIGAVFLIISIVNPTLLAGILAGSRGTEELIKGATDYVMPIMAGSVFIILYDILGTVALLEGADRLFRISTLVIFVLNLAGDLFAVKFGMGLQGIAIASALSYMGAFMTIALNFFSSLSVFHLRPIIPMPKEIAQIFILGLPMAVNYICKIIWPISVNRTMIHYGTMAGLAALSIQDAVQYFPRALCSGMSYAVIILTGIFFSERDSNSLKEERKIILGWSLVGGSLLSFVLALAAPLIMSIFTSDPKVHELSVSALRYYLLGLPFLAFNYAAISYLQGLGEIKKACIYTFANHGLLAVLFTYALGKSMGDKGVFMSFAACEMGMAVLPAIMSFYKRSQSKDLFTDLSSSAIDYDLRRTLKTVDDASSVSKEINEKLLARGIAPSKAYMIALCAEELAVNSIEHGFKKDSKPHSADIRVAMGGDTIIIRLRDDCKRFDLTERYRIINPDDPTKNIGLRIIFKYADEVNYSSALNMNNVCIRIKINESRWK